VYCSGLDIPGSRVSPVLLVSEVKIRGDRVNNYRFERSVFHAVRRIASFKIRTTAF
jgi:hypothetical protein